MSQPSQLTPTDQDALVKQIGIGLMRAAPQEWQQIKTEYRAAGRYYELTAEVVESDGESQAWTASHDVAMLFAKLRAGMHSEDGGTWFNARYQIDRPSRYNLEFDRSEPNWRTPPPLQAYRDELRFFPRAEDDVPEWLMHRLSGLRPDAPARRFRIARIFDGRGPSGRPSVNRPPVAEDEQATLLSYLDRAPLVLPERGFDVDRLAAEPGKTVPVAFHCDGTWIWPAAVNYYLRHYGLPPEPALVEHAREHDFVPPEIDEATAAEAAATITGPRPPGPPGPPRPDGGRPQPPGAERPGERAGTPENDHPPSPPAGIPAVRPDLETSLPPVAPPRPGGGIGAAFGVAGRQQERPADEPPVPAAPPVPTPQPPVSQPEPPTAEAHRAGDPPEIVLDRLRDRLDELGVAQSAYRIGEPTPNAWYLEAVDEGWQVGWFDDDLSAPMLFDEAGDAAAFLLGKLMLTDSARDAGGRHSSGPAADESGQMDNVDRVTQVGTPNGVALGGATLGDVLPDGAASNSVTSDGIDSDGVTSGDAVPGGVLPDSAVTLGSSAVPLGGTAPDSPGDHLPERDFERDRDRGRGRGQARDRQPMDDADVARNSSFGLRGPAEPASDFRPATFERRRDEDEPDALPAAFDSPVIGADPEPPFGERDGERSSFGVFEPTSRAADEEHTAEHEPFGIGGSGVNGHGPAPDELPAERTASHAAARDTGDEEQEPLFEPRQTRFDDTGRFDFGAPGRFSDFELPERGEQANGERNDAGLPEEPDEPVGARSRSRFDRGDLDRGDSRRHDFPGGAIEHGDVDRGATHRDDFDRADFDRNDNHRGDFDRENVRNRREPDRGKFDRNDFDRSEFDRGEFDREESHRDDFGRAGADHGEFDRGEFDREDDHRDELDRADFGRRGFDREEQRFGGFANFDVGSHGQRNQDNGWENGHGFDGPGRDTDGSRENGHGLPARPDRQAPVATRDVHPEVPPAREASAPASLATMGSPADSSANAAQPPHWPIQPLDGEPPLTLFRHKQMTHLPAGTEIDRFGDELGNLTYDSGTPFEQRSLVPDWVNRPYHVYQLQKPIEVLVGVAIPWFDQPGGGTAYLLPDAIAEHVERGELVQVEVDSDEHP